MINKSAAKESVSDVAIGLTISFPVAFVVLYLTGEWGFSITATALTQTIVFTFLALLRKYCVRMFFMRNG